MLLNFITCPVQNIIMLTIMISSTKCKLPFSMTLMTVVIFPSTTTQSTVVPFKPAAALSICNSDVSGDNEVLEIWNPPKFVTVKFSGRLSGPLEVINWSPIPVTISGCWTVQAIPVEFVLHVNVSWPPIHTSSVVEEAAKAIIIDSKLIFFIVSIMLLYNYIHQSISSYSVILLLL